MVTEDCETWSQRKLNRFLYSVIFLVFPALLEDGSIMMPALQVMRKPSPQTSVDHLPTVSQWWHWFWNVSIYSLKTHTNHVSKKPGAEEMLSLSAEAATGLASSLASQGRALQAPEGVAQPMVSGNPAAPTPTLA